MNKTKNEVFHKGERPECDVFFEVESKGYTESDWRVVSFRAIITDVVVLHKLQNILYLHSEYQTTFENILSKAIGEGGYNTPKYYVATQDSIGVFFECHGSPMDMDNITEAFKLYLASVPSLSISIG